MQPNSRFGYASIHCNESEWNSILFFSFWLCCVFFAARGLSLVVASRVYSSLRCTGFSLLWLLLLRSTGSRHAGFSSCSTRAQQLWLAGSRAQAQQLWHMGLVAPRHVGSSWTRARTHVPCIGRRIRNHCATREAPSFLIKTKFLHRVELQVSLYKGENEGPKSSQRCLASKSPSDSRSPDPHSLLFLLYHKPPEELILIIHGW